MSDSTHPLIGPAVPPARPARSPVAQLIRHVRNQIMAGLLLLLPFAVTLWIVLWLYRTLEQHLISPAAHFVIRLIESRHNGAGVPAWFSQYAAPVLGMIAAAILLYLAGAVARLRLTRIFDYLLLRVPVVKVIHGAVKRVFESMRGQGAFARFKRVVLVSFPHPGMRVPAFVTSSCLDLETQRTILCVYVPTTPVPTSGYMILIPEEEVTELDWDLEETIQAVVSFGLTAPGHVRYHRPATPVFAEGDH